MFFYLIFKLRISNKDNKTAIYNPKISLSSLANIKAQKLDLKTHAICAGIENRPDPAIKNCSTVYFDDNIKSRTELKSQVAQQ